MSLFHTLASLKDFIAGFCVVLYEGIGGYIVVKGFGSES